MDYTPYTCTRIGGEGGLRNTDIEHIVTLAEAQDSGLSPEQLALFDSDIENLTVAMPRENRNVKIARDAADYLPAHNRCWFAGKVVRVKQKWGMTVDWREAQTLMTALAGCSAEQIARPTCEAVGNDVGGDTVRHPPVQTFRNCAAMRAAPSSRREIRTR